MQSRSQLSEIDKVLSILSEILEFTTEDNVVRLVLNRTSGRKNPPLATPKKE